MSNIIETKTLMQGEYNLVIKRGDGTVEETGWFPNLILNQGLDRCGGASGIVISYAQIGSGNATPAFTDTSLNTYVAGSSAISTASSSSNEGAPLYRTTLTYTFSFAQGAVVGNMTEVGVGWGSSGNTLFSRALILDTGGSPTTLTLVAIDQLTVYYRLRVSPPITDTTGSVTISGTPYNYTARVAVVANFANTVQYTSDSSYVTGIYGTACATYGAGSTLQTIVDAGPTGTPASGATAVMATYVPGTYYKDGTVTFSVSQGNSTGGIQALKIVYGGVYQTMRYQYEFDSVIPKDNTKVFTITLRNSWNRV